MSNPKIILNNICYSIPDTSVNFDKLSMTFTQQRYGIVGDNGVGKSTLLKLLVGELQPHSGTVHDEARLCYCSQLYLAKPFDTVAQALGIQHILAALQRVYAGWAETDDFDVIGGQWDIEDKAYAALSYFGLHNIQFDSDYRKLSGGQQTKVQLAKLQLKSSDFILLDEPTNNLDYTSRDQLYSFIKNSNTAFIIISHDRTLLNLMDNIIELTTLGITQYGGNFDFYHHEKYIQEQASFALLDARVSELTKAKKSIQTRMQRHEKAESKGLKARKAEIQAKGCYDKIAFKTQKGRSETTNKRIRTQASRKLKHVNNALSQAKAAIEIKTDMNVQLESSRIPSHKHVIDIHNLTFSYSNNQEALFKNFDFQLIGPERLALTGSNGCGKSTLIHLILGQLQPTSGCIQVGVQSIRYIDQQLNFLIPEQSLLQNFMTLNPEFSEFDARTALAWFNFRNHNADKSVKHLSGGECIRAGIAIALCNKSPPECLILDEPTNNLDMRSVEIIEKALSGYLGALIVCSHDSVFLSNLSITREINIEAITCK